LRDALEVKRKEAESAALVPDATGHAAGSDPLRRRRARSLTEIVMEPATAAAGPTRALSMCGTEGWLDVLAERLDATDQWRRRYVRVQTGRMICHVGHLSGAHVAGEATPSKDSPALVVHLNPCTCMAEGQYITINCGLTGTYKLRAASVSEARFWALDIEAACVGATADEAVEDSPAVPTPVRNARRRAFLMEDASTATDRPVMQAEPRVGSPAGCAATSLDGGTPTAPPPSPAWAELSANSLNGSFSMENPCASPVATAVSLRTSEPLLPQRFGLGRLRAIANRSKHDYGPAADTSRE
jgi:hypothetical protein